MPILPDDKNWTWVLERPCPECGFEGATFPFAGVAGAIRANAAEFAELLAHPDVRLRPDGSTWSALEYGCHVRDVYRLYLYRLELMLEHDGPRFPNWDQDATAVEERYDLQDPVEVAGELAVAADLLARGFESVGPMQLQRTGFRSDGAAFTIDSFARYLVHDPVHHARDVQRGYRRLAGGLLADDIPVAHTPPGGYGATFPSPVLSGCTEPLVEGAPDLRGIWRTVSAMVGGKPAPEGHPLLRYTERIEQCGNRIVDMGGGTIADARADGTEENGVHDVYALDYVTPIHVVASYEDGVFVLRPVGIPGIEVRRWLDDDGHMVWTRPDLGGVRVVLERISEATYLAEHT
ncbi:MAG: hypothetical protein RI900_3012 [Actinomycetota bacterium]